MGSSNGRHKYPPEIVYAEALVHGFRAAARKLGYCYNSIPKLKKRVWIYAVRKHLPWPRKG